MPRTRDNASKVTRSTTLADMVERLALAGCGSSLWPNPYAREYHRAVVRRVIGAMTPGDIELIKGTK